MSNAVAPAPPPIFPTNGHLSFTGEDMGSVLALNTTERWRAISQDRWWLPAGPTTLQQPWRWDFPTWQPGDDAFLPCEVGLRSGTCSPLHTCTRECAMLTQGAFGSRQPVLCNGVGRYPRFSFINGREPYSLVDFALAFGKPRVKLLLIGDSMMQSVYYASLCHLSRLAYVTQSNVKHVKVHYTGHIADQFGTKTFYELRTHTFTIAPEGLQPTVLELSYLFKYRVRFATMDILQAICPRFDFVSVSWGAHYEAADDHANFTSEMTTTLSVFKTCAVNHGTRVAFLSHATHRFMAKHGWYTAGAAHGKNVNCALIENSTIEQADWVTPHLRAAAQRVGGIALVPPPWTETVRQPPDDDAPFHLHWVPLFDTLFDMLGFNVQPFPVGTTFARSRGIDCLHVVYAPDMNAPVFDAWTLAVLGAKRRPDPVGGRFKATHTAEQLAAVKNNFALVDQVRHSTPVEKQADSADAFVTMLHDN